MNAVEQVEKLTTASILRETDTSDIALTTTYESEVAQYLDRLRRGTVDDADLAGTTSSPPDGFNQLIDQDLWFGAHLLSLADHLDPPVSRDWHALIPLLEQLRREEPPSRGSPAGFFAVHGDLLPSLVAFRPGSVVYVWLDDCDPCNVMREALETAIAEEEGSDDIGLFSVYGPESADILSARYDVEGGPATLFFRESTVDSRMYGAQPVEAIRSELEIIRRSPSVEDPGT